MIVFPRRLAIDYVFASSNNRIAARRATCADALRFFQEPDAHFEAEIGRSVEVSAPTGQMSTVLSE